MGGGAHEHAAGEAAHEDAVSTGGALRVPEHFTANLSFGVDVLRSGKAQASFLFNSTSRTSPITCISLPKKVSSRRPSIPFRGLCR